MKCSGWKSLRLVPGQLPYRRLRHLVHLVIPLRLLFHVTLHLRSDHVNESGEKRPFLPMKFMHNYQVWEVYSQSTCALIFATALFRL